MRKRTTENAGQNLDPDQLNDRQFVTALHRGLEILRAFRPNDRAGLSNHELAERTQLPNSTVSRLTFTLLNLGYLIYDKGTGRYRMGVPVLSLGYVCLGGFQIREAIQVYMQELADACGDGVLVGLGGRDDMAMTYISCARSEGMISLQLNVGSRISLARSAMGRAYFVGTSEEERAEIEGRIKERGSSKDISAFQKAIKQAKAQISDRGFYTNIGEWKSDANSISVPFRSPDANMPMMAFNLGGPAYNLPKKRLIEDFGPKLVELANKAAGLPG
jgi:DNA-binding IclR family transcriptional regulator